MPLPAALLDTDLVAPAGNDAACLRGPAARGGPAELVVPVGAAGEALRTTWYLRGPAATGASAFDLEVTFADGKKFVSRAVVGEEVVVRPSPAADATLVTVGTTTAGAALVGTTWALPTGRPDVAVQQIRVTSRGGGYTACLLDVALGAPDGASPARTNTAGWYPFLVGPTLPGALPQATPVEPDAGRRGFVQRDADGHLRFADGTRARFWGVDLYHSWALPPKEDADRLAATLAGLGVNLVRLHHLDLPATGLVNPDRGKPGQPAITPEVADRLDYFLSRCKAHGIYLLLEVATFRTFTAADQVRDPGGVPNGHKLVSTFEDDWLAAYLAHFEALWGRTNPYTKLRYADDPMVAMVELTNEHSMIANWGGGLENLPPAHLARLDARWNEWLRSRYADDAALAKAWAGSARPGLQPGESLAAGTVSRDPVAAMFGGGWPEQRRLDLGDFYASLDRGFLAAVAEKAKALGFRVPLVPGVGYATPWVQYQQLPYDVADLHLEIDGARHGAQRQSSVLAWPTGEDILDHLAGAIEGRALIISELNHPYPNRYMAEAPLLWGTLASAQDWDALVWNSFELGVTPEGESSMTDQFDVRNATVKLAQFPTASSMFRSGAIAPAAGSWPLTWAPEAARAAWAIERPPAPSDLDEVAIALSQRVRTRFDPTTIPPRVAAAPTAGVGWWPDPGILLVDRPGIRARVGPPGAPVEGAAGGAGVREVVGLTVALSTWAAVSLASTDGRPLGEGPALLTVATRQENTGMAWGQAGRQVRAAGVPPVLVEPARGTITFTWPRTPQVVWLDQAGGVGGAVEVKGQRGAWTISLDALRSPWILVR